jgi:hypothetical protein
MENECMRIRLDIPDKIPYKLVKKAHQEGMTVNDLVLPSIQAMLKTKRGRQKFADPR